MTVSSRRRFLAKGVAGGLAARAVLRASAWAQPRGANDAIRVAVVGLHGKGAHHLQMLKAIPGVRIVALCDVDEAVLEKRAGELAADGVQVARSTSTSASCSRARTSTPSPSPRPTTGTR